MVPVLAPVVVPLVIAGMFVMTPVKCTLNDTFTIREAKNKIVTIIKKEGYTTGFDQNGAQIKFPYEEKITVERTDDKSKEKAGIISQIGHGIWNITTGVTSKVYRWVTKG